MIKQLVSHFVSILTFKKMARTYEIILVMFIIDSEIVGGGIELWFR